MEKPDLSWNISWYIGSRGTKKQTNLIWTLWVQEENKSRKDLVNYTNFIQRIYVGLPSTTRKRCKINEKILGNRRNKISQERQSWSEEKIWTLCLPVSTKTFCMGYDLRGRSRRPFFLFLPPLFFPSLPPAGVTFPPFLTNVYCDATYIFSNCMDREKIFFDNLDYLLKSFQRPMF